MIEFHFSGIIVGICSFLIIGLFHPLVIKAEYYFGVRFWWVFLVLGLVGLAGSLLVAHQILSIILGVFAFSSFWGIYEMFEQRERVRKGWYPKRDNKSRDRRRKSEESATEIWKQSFRCRAFDERYSRFCCGKIQVVLRNPTCA